LCSCSFRPHPQAYPYCDSWSLSWAYRRAIILQELQDAQGDIVCLQEVQADHFEQHIQPFMAELGYQGIFKHKSRDIGDDYGKVCLQFAVCSAPIFFCL
jgi:CCR4-NOT transcription complex subunit 6